MSTAKSKRVCRSRTARSDVGKDHLSSLPDNLLVKILDLVGIHEAPRTHGLSKRWRFLWAFCTSLEFEVDGIDGVSPGFVDNVIGWHKGSEVQLFRLIINLSEEMADDYVIDLPIESWLRFAIDRGVTDLQLSFIPPGGIGDTKDLPLVLFEGSSITRLCLSFCDLYPVTVGLSSLKTVRLSQVMFSEDSFEQFVSGCPVLDSVILDSCAHFSKMSVRITNPSVKTLIIMDTPDEMGYDHIYEPVEIVAPLLKHLVINGVLRPEYSLIVPCLVSAKTEFSFFNEGNLPTLERFLNSLYCPALHLCAWCIQVLSLSKMNHQIIAPLSNVKHLHLRLPLLKCELLGLAHVVEVFPFLESLDISFGFWDDGKRKPLSDDIRPFDFSIPEFRKIEWNDVLDENQGNSELESLGWKSISSSFFDHLRCLKILRVNGFFGLGAILGSKPSKKFCSLHWNLFWREIQLVQKLRTNSPLLAITDVQVPVCKNLDASAEFVLRQLVFAHVYGTPPTSYSRTMFWRDD